MKLKQMFCKTCGAQIDLYIITYEKIYRVNEDGELVRNDNNDAWYPSEVIEEFLCSEDTTHEIGESKELEEWTEEVREVYKNICEI